MNNQHIRLSSDHAVTGVITQILDNGHATVFWDGEHEGDFVQIADLEPLHGGRLIVQDIVELVPDDRAYEFGIGDIGSTDDPYYAATQETRPTGKRKLIVLRKCGGCGGEFPPEHLMSASLGRACTDCYDEMSG